VLAFTIPRALSAVIEPRCLPPALRAREVAGIHLSLPRLTGAEARRPPRSKHRYFTVKVIADEELAVKFCDPAKLAVME